MDKYGIKLFEELSEILWENSRSGKSGTFDNPTWELPARIYNKLPPVAVEQINAAVEDLVCRNLTKAQYIRGLRRYLFHLSK